MLGEIEARSPSSEPKKSPSPDNLLILTLDTSSAETGGGNAGGLAEIGGRHPGKVRKHVDPAESEVGNDQLAKFLIVQQMFPEDEVNSALAAVKKANKAATGQTLPRSLLAELCQGEEAKSDKVLSALIDRTKFAYVPLEYYDIDRQVVRMPDELTIGRLFVPFDPVSRTIMVRSAIPSTPRRVKPSGNRSTTP